jgi:hypothetical protein
LVDFCLFNRATVSAAETAAFDAEKLARS